MATAILKQIQVAGSMGFTAQVSADEENLDILKDNYKDARYTIVDEYPYGDISTSQANALLDSLQAQYESDPILTNSYIANASNGVELYDQIGLNPDLATYARNVTASLFSPTKYYYNYQVSLLNGDLGVVVAPNVSAQIEVGAGGTATVVGGTRSTLYLWHQKNLIWENNGSGNTLDLSQFIGNGDGQQTPTGALILNLLTGQGTNPYGGTLQVSGVDTVLGVYALGTYVVANNAGDDIEPGIGGGNAILVGGTGNDTLDGSNSQGSVSILVAGTGTSILNSGFGAAIFVYNGGIDTIRGFNAYSGVTDTLDLSSVAGVTSFAAVMADATASGGNTVLTFGVNQTVTLEGRTPSQLTASDFTFTPIVAFDATPLSTAVAGAVVPITLAITDAVGVNTAGGVPTLTLSDGATATYDAAASNFAGHLLTFDYTVGATDQATNLAVTGVNTNGATVTSATGKAVNFAGANRSLGVQVGAPLTVSSVTVSPTGEADTGQQVLITLQMSQPVTITLGTVLFGQTADPFGLLLNDGAVATYSASLSNQAAGRIVFTDTVANADHTRNLAIIGIDGLTPQPGLFTTTTVKNGAGYNANFAAAVGASTGLAIGPPVYVGTVSANAAASPTGVGEEADAGQTFRLTLTLNTAVTVNTAGGSPTLTLSDGSVATYDAAASNPSAGALVFDDTVGTSDHSPHVTILAVNLHGATVLAAGAQPANFAGAVGSPIGAGLQINPSPLKVTGVTAGIRSVGTFTYDTVTLTLSEPVTVTRPSFGVYTGQTVTPGLVLNNGDAAQFTTVSSNQLTFADQQTPTDNGNISVASVDLALGAGHGSVFATFTDAAGYNADFTNALNVPTGVSFADPLYVSTLATSVTSGESQGGHPLQITLGLSEAATLSGGTPTLVLNDGGTATYDASASNLGAGTLVFDYTPRVGEEFVSPFISTINLNGASLRDAGGNTADLSGFSAVPLQFQIGASHILTAAITQIGNLVPGAATNLLLVMSENVSIDTAGGVPSLTLSNGAIATYDAALTATTASIGPNSVGQVVFDYTVGRTDATRDLEIARVNLNGATVTDVVSGLAANLALPATQYLGAAIACFAAGTRILTARGEVRVERLAVGDTVPTCVCGDDATIRWIGRSRVAVHRHPRPETVNPIRVREGAFGGGLPTRDLRLSPNHAVFADGVLVPVRHLVNGTTIRQEQVARIDYWHVELDRHDVLLADGLPCESYLDTGNRAAFANADVAMLHPDFRATSSEAGRAATCADLVERGPVVERLRSQLADGLDSQRAHRSAARAASVGRR